MQSAEGMPADQVAWGRLSGDADLENLLKIHRLEFDLAQKTLPIARQHGSNLLTQIVATLQDGHKFPGLQRLAEPVRLGLLVGHDTNIANVSRLLNRRLADPGLPAERGLARRRAGLRIAARGADRPALCAARLLCADAGADAPGARPRLRDAARHGGGRPAGLRRDCHEKACPLERFVEIANEAIDPGCVTIKP